MNAGTDGKKAKTQAQANADRAGKPRWLFERKGVYWISNSSVAGATLFEPVFVPPYKLKFSSQQWEELISMTFEPFTFGKGARLTRGQWMAMGEMALGKAQRVDAGIYKIGEQDDEVNMPQWAEELRDIAAVIFDFFQPGDGKL